MKRRTKLKAAPSVAAPAVVEIKREVIVSPDYFSVYANDIQVQTSPWDMRFIFGEILEPATPEKTVVTVKQLGSLRISPQLAKRLVGMMAGQLMAYEKRFGEIPETETEPKS